MEPVVGGLIREPLVTFAILLVVILTIPLIFERLRLPGLVGLLIAGVVLGPQGLALLNKQSETIRLLSDIGLVYLMFVAGLEIDIHQFRKTKNRSLGFGSFTFLIPIIFGTLVGRLFGFGWNSSILIGSLFASHTLLAYPIVSRLGVVNNEAVTVTIGATIFTDVGALMVLAVCVGIHGGNFTLVNLLTLFGSLAIYSVVILFGFDWAGREFFRRSGDEEGNQFLFVLLAVFLAALSAQLIGIEKIVGAFLAGLAVNDAVGEGPVKEKVVFVGSVLFIPIFFVDMGLLIDIQAFIKTLASAWLTLAILVGLISSKFLAALAAKLMYRYNWQEMLTMWSLSLPQVAATLAATLVGYRTVNPAGERLLTEGVLNSVLVLMVVTSTLGPLITSRFAPGLSVSEAFESSQLTPIPMAMERVLVEYPFKVIVPVYNPKTEQYLIEMAALLARYEGGEIVPLAIVKPHAHMDAPELEAAFEQGDLLLDSAMQLSRELQVEAQPLLRIDDDVAKGISRASREQQASLIVMGWGQRSGLRARLFGNVIDSVLWASHCSVAITRLLDSPTKIQQILVPVESLSNEALQPLQFARILAEVNQAQITVLHVCDRRASEGKIAWNRSQLELLVSRWVPEGNLNINIQVIPHEDVVKAIVNIAESFDLLVMRSERRRTTAGLAISDITSELVRQLTCSLVMLGEPQRRLSGTSMLE